MDQEARFLEAYGKGHGQVVVAEDHWGASRDGRCSYELVGKGKEIKGQLHFEEG